MNIPPIQQTFGSLQFISDFLFISRFVCVRFAQIKKIHLTFMARKSIIVIISEILMRVWLSVNVSCLHACRYLTAVGCCCCLYMSIFMDTCVCCIWFGVSLYIPFSFRHMYLCYVCRYFVSNVCQSIHKWINIIYIDGMNADTHCVLVT